MSFLTGLYLVGAASIAFPIVFHLIRRRPQRRLQFSSLMFLQPSPPRLTERSRIDHLLLLLLRALALLLVTIAFMRPFYRQEADATLNNVRGRRVAILLDTSASMRRGDLWPQAVQVLETELDQLPGADDVALFTFDDHVTTIVGFSEAARSEIAPRRTLVRDAIAQLAPTWAHTDMATALITTAESLAVMNDRTDSNAAAQILLISDMQEGSRLQGLDGYPWPQNVQVSVKSIASTVASSNATLRLLNSSASERAASKNRRSAQSNTTPPRGEVRVRVENAADATAEQFHVHWASANAMTDAKAASIYVPAGQSRVLRMSQPQASLRADRLILSGDDAPFDNQYFVNPTHQEVVHCLYVGDDTASDTEGLLFYLSLALPETPQTRVEIRAADQEPLRLTGRDAPGVVIVGKSLSPEQQQAIARYARQGGTVLAVLRDHQMLASLGPPFAGWTIAAANELPTDAAASYALLGEIDFAHPLLAAFAGSGYSDFTMIRFWNYRQVELDAGSSARVLASFDNGHPAFIELGDGQGKYLVLTSGWNPRDSQLARSWKFAVLLSEILRHACALEQLAPSLVVNQQIQLSSDPVRLNRASLQGLSDHLTPRSSMLVETLAASENEGGSLGIDSKSTPANQARLLKPDGSEVVLGAGVRQFNETNLPGLYRATWPAGEQAFAVNLAASESRTAPLATDQLEAMGVQFGQHATQLEETARLRQRLDIELESEQQVWRWLILAALVLLIVETWLAGRYASLPAEQTARGLVAAS